MNADTSWKRGTSVHLTKRWVGKCASCNPTKVGRPRGCFGLHFQVPPHAQGKLVRVSQGLALDVAVDLRADSPTFGQHWAVELSSNNGVQFWIPEGFAHGFVALEEGTLFDYMCTSFYAPQSEQSLRWDDPLLGIDWGVNSPRVSPKDEGAPGFEHFESPFLP